MNKDFSKFEERIEVIFNNKALLKQAFTHRSYLNEQRDSSLKHNERLEFLGDAVLELVVTRYLFDEYPDTMEGELTAYRASLVNTVSIAQAAEDWGMNEYILLSKGEAKDTGKARKFILADAFEAVIGAIYMDQGYDVAKEFIEKSLFHKLEEIVAKGLWQDSKSMLQERAQEIVNITPTYSVLEETGPDHDKRFVIGVHLSDELIIKGKGKSKQEAEQNAARAALEEKGWT